MVQCLFFLLQVFLSTRRGTWVINRVSDTGGLPIDIVHTRRVKLFLANKSPPALLGAIVKRYLNQRLDHDLYSLTPQYPPMAQHPMVNDDLGNRIVCGSIKIKTDVRQFTAAGVEFTDGSFEDDIDIVSFQIEYIVLVKATHLSMQYQTVYLFIHLLPFAILICFYDPSLRFGP